MICEFKTNDGPLFIRADVIQGMETMGAPKKTSSKGTSYLKGVPSPHQDQTLLHCDEPLGKIVLQQHVHDALTIWAQSLMFQHGIENDPEETEETPQAPEETPDCE